MVIRCQFNYTPFLLTCIALLGVSCSSSKPKKVESPKIESESSYQEIQRPGWLKVPKRFSFRDEYSEFIHHPFFDEIPGKDFDQKILNAILLTPNDSKHFYSLDLPSGQIIKTFSFCEQKDLLGNYSSSIEKPQFSLGIVPRLLDATANPQKVVVFGEVPKGLNPGSVTPISVFGGVMELECKIWPCERSNGWEKRAVLLAKFLDDEEFKEVKNIDDLKDKIDWQYFKSFMENSQGVHSGLAFPKIGYQIKGQLSGEEALNMVFKDGHIFSSLELFTMRSACHKLYDFIYDSVTKNPQAGKRIEKFLKGQKGFQNFKEFISFFLKNYGDRYFTCNKYVRPSNPFDDPKRHWFFTGFSAFMNLRGINYYYSCSDTAWGRNPYNFKTQKPEINFEDEISKCSSAQLNTGFEMAPTKLESLLKQNMLSYKYLTSDSSSGGSHKKVYGWVPFYGLSPYCKDANERNSYLKDFQVSFYPKDIRWVPID